MPVEDTSVFRPEELSRHDPWPCRTCLPRTPTAKTAHQGLHREQRSPRGEHPGRSREPVIKVADPAWPEFEKPDLERVETFALAVAERVLTRMSERTAGERAAVAPASAQGRRACDAAGPAPQRQR